MKSFKTIKTILGLVTAAAGVAACLAYLCGGYEAWVGIAGFTASFWGQQLIGSDE